MRQTLQEYLDLRQLGRRKKNNLYLQTNNQVQELSPMKLDKDNKCDKLIGEIVDYVKGVVGAGPLFNKFQAMM